MTGHDRGEGAPPPHETGLSEALAEAKGPIPEAGLLGRAVDAFGIVFAVGIFAGMVILIQEVVLRYVFNAPTIWAHETTVFLSGIAFVYGGLFCAARDEHIRVVIVYDMVPPRIRRWFDVGISLICALASAFFAYASWLMVERAIWRPDGSFHIETSGSAWDPAYPGILKVFLMVTMGLLTLQFIVLAWNHARRRA